MSQRQAYGSFFAAYIIVVLVLIFGQSETIWQMATKPAVQISSRIAPR